MGFKPRPPAAIPAEVSKPYALLRSLCAELPGAEETWSFGHPNFCAGTPPRAFAAFEQVKGTWLCAVRVGPELRDALLGQGQPYVRVPYDRSGDWIGIAADRLDPGRLAALLAGAHALLSRRR
ncbi:MAG TPA: MmcQ/YjbR family DNA-binding protein [Kofleriaceae bacterium]|nr:MmcQ/YjbR family DNA-binding protein [Kofleriaceae bacterium]